MFIICSLSLQYRTNIAELIVIIYWTFLFASGMFVTERFYDNGLFVVGITFRFS